MHDEHWLVTSQIIIIILPWNGHFISLYSLCVCNNGQKWPASVDLSLLVTLGQYLIIVALQQRKLVSKASK